jgi:hypothetical protein
MKKIALLPLVAALAAAGGCARSADTASAPAERNTPQAVAAPAAAKPAGQPAAQPVAQAADDSLSVELSGKGLSTGSRGLHHANFLEFGQPRAKVVADISEALGAPTASGRNADCPSGPVDFTSFGTLDLHFEGDRFAGWVIDQAGGPEVESYHGLSFGDRRNELDGDADIEVVKGSTLGTELIVNGVGVIMSGPRPTDRVTNLFAGVTCFAR